MRANYHTHSRWCKHGTGEIEDYLEVAVAHGIEEIAITEHVPHKDNHDKWRLQWEEFPAFDAALNRAIAAYQGKIRIIKGFECEYYPEAVETYRMLQEKYGYELLLLGQHCNAADRRIDYFLSKTEREMRLYADEVCAGLQTGLFRFLAHPDLALLGYPHVWDKHCENMMRQIFACCERLDIPVEINANGARDDRGYPNRDAFFLSKEYRLRYLINADAHQPEHLIGIGVEKAERLARELGIQPMEFLER